MIAELVKRHLLRQFIQVMLFSAVICLFFLVIDKPPLEMLWSMLKYSMGDLFSLAETLGKTTPILFCALAVIVPARLGLISVGGEGQFYFGALCGTALVLNFYDAGAWLLPAMIFAAACGGALWGLIPALMKTIAGVHETISTLLMNYVGVLLVSHQVYGAWKDPANLGWPASQNFPPNAVLPSITYSGIHLGLLIAILIALLLHVLLNHSRWGLSLKILQNNPSVAPLSGLRPKRQILLVMMIGGALAGIGGISEVSAIQGRLQPTISSGYGLSGFLVAWLAAQQPLRAVFIAFLFGTLLAAADSLQMFARVPAASAIVLQGLIFLTALIIFQWSKQRRQSIGGRDE